LVLMLTALGLAAGLSALAISRIHSASRAKPHRARAAAALKIDLMRPSTLTAQKPVLISDRKPTRLTEVSRSKSARLVLPEDREGKRPRSLRERFVEEMEQTSRGAQDNEADQSQGGWENWFYSQRAFPGSIPSNALGTALGQATVNNGGLKGEPGDPTPPGGPPAQATWVSIGPSTIPNGQTDTSVGPATPVSGRVSAIAVHPTNPNIAFTGGAQGGVWKSTNALSATPTWTPVTDHQASLAVGDIAIDPVNPNIIYVGTGEPNGSCDSYYGQGILRSTDGGVTWKLLGADPGGPFVNQAVSKILIDPTTAGSATTTTLWASTAIGATSSGTAQCLTAPGAWNGAVWRSTDSGATWVLQDVPTGAVAPNARIHDMVLDPTNSNILYVAVRSVPTAANGGVWKSVNAKGAPATFAKLAGGFPNTVTAFPGIRRITLAIGGSSAPGTLYATMEGVSRSSMWGMFKSTDNGATWSHVAAASGNVSWTGTTVTATSGAFATDGSWPGRRIVLRGAFGDISATIGSVTDSTHLQLSDVTVGGSTVTGTWSTASYPSYCDGQCFYDMTLSVDPTDLTASRLYVGGNPNVFVNSGSQAGHAAHYVWRSTDGGANWTAISQGSAITGGVHTDDHEIAFDTSTTPARVYDGNDGGIWRSDDQGASWVNMNTNIAITQFQSVSTHPSNPTILIGGTQDNGTNLQNPAKQPLPKWFHSDFGDGGQAVIDQSTPLRMFHTYFNQANNFMGPSKAIDGGVTGPGGTPGGSWDFVGSYAGYGGVYYNGMNPTDPVSFYAPLRLHPAFTPNVVYFGSNKLYRSANPLPPGPGVASWTVKSPALASGTNFLSAIGALPVLVAGKEVIYIGAADGRISVSSNVDASASVATWSAFNGACPGTPAPPLPCRFVTDIQVAGSDPTGNTAYATFSGFNVNTPGQPGHVFRTTNGLGGSPTWTNLSGDLPDVPTNAIAVDPTRTPSILYVGTDIGVFQSLDDGAHWSYLSSGHPVVSVFGLDRNPTTGQIVSSTHGRGMFQLISNGLPDTTAPICGGSITGTGQFTGTALDAGANDTGIASIVLLPSSTNLVISSITYTSPGSATYIVTTINHLLPGSGTVRVTDYAGNFCDTAVSLPAGAPGAGFFTLTPCRAVDTRAAGGAIAAGADRTFFLAGTCGIPADATALSVNVTVTQPTATGDLRVFAAGTSPPSTSVINFRSGQTRANNAIVQVSTSGGVTVLNDQSSGTVQVIVDVNGYFK
jgi:hypothetical protein